MTEESEKARSSSLNTLFLFLDIAFLEVRNPSNPWARAKGGCVAGLGYGMVGRWWQAKGWGAGPEEWVSTRHGGRAQTAVHERTESTDGAGLVGVLARSCRAQPSAGARARAMQALPPPLPPPPTSLHDAYLEHSAKVGVL